MPFGLMFSGLSSRCGALFGRFGLFAFDAAYGSLNP